MDQSDINSLVRRANEMFNKWKNVPAPERGELIRIFGHELRSRKEELSRIITTDMGKTIRESRGEVQEAIDMCDFAVGLSRQLYGNTMPSERPKHRLQETWLPLGVVGVISAFNFPVAVWAWNFCLAIICGNAVIWKPSTKGNRSTYFLQRIFKDACEKAGKSEFVDLNQLYYGDKEEAIALAKHKGIALISATGSVEMGKVIAPIVAQRLGKILLELGGNNAAIISQHADLDLAIKGCVFAAVGTTGQRCTTLRRLFVHNSIYAKVLEKLTAAYHTIKIGDPQKEEVLLGPIISDSAYKHMASALRAAQAEGATLWHGGGCYNNPNGNTFGPYVYPAIVTANAHLEIMKKETFAPILYMIPYAKLQDAIDMVNCVEQGLSNSIFTNDMNEAEQFLEQAYSGIVNVNAGTSGAEIGGAFGGEKDTGGGRESGSDSWKSYMRRVTSTINYSGEMPLAQGIKFDNE